MGENASKYVVVESAYATSPSYGSLFGRPRELWDVSFLPPDAPTRAKVLRLSEGARQQAVSELGVLLADYLKPEDCQSLATVSGRVAEWMAQTSVTRTITVRVACEGSRAIVMLWDNGLSLPTLLGGPDHFDVMAYAVEHGVSCVTAWFIDGLRVVHLAYEATPPAADTSGSLHDHRNDERGEPQHRRGRAAQRTLTRPEVY
ncbi:hypothetical protein KDL01_33665 [Actinospica durhamensis]|uniref:Uncharacterized protein n=1 Tax=Actinospica durhamensis TaxID=1508375 RepID=A0A941EZQ7_9ACTN|nr:hypothetical protein [Actinospica durhamensis]MBR7838269.1 hypothetical protein [Actinospica durhamensis]